MAAFTRYAASLITWERPEELAAIFDVVEQPFAQGEEDAKDAVATCFLEVLLN